MSKLHKSQQFVTKVLTDDNKNQTVLVLVIETYRAGEPEPGVFGSLEPEPLEKKQEPEPLGKKVRSRSR